MCPKKVEIIAAIPRRYNIVSQPMVGLTTAPSTCPETPNGVALRLEPSSAYHPANPHSRLQTTIDLLLPRYSRKNFLC